MPRKAKCLCSSQYSETITSLEQVAKILDKIQTNWISIERFYHIIHVTWSELSLRLSPAAFVNLDLYTYNCFDLQRLLLSFQILEVKPNHELKYKSFCGSHYSETITSLEQVAKILDKIQTSWI